MVDISISDMNVIEGGLNTSKPVTLTVSATGLKGNESSSVAWATRDGTAKAGEDYQAASGTVTVSRWTPTASITVKVLGDIRYEGPSPEVFSVVLSNPSLGTLVKTQGRVLIHEDD